MRDCVMTLGASVRDIADLFELLGDILRKNCSLR